MPAGRSDERQRMVRRGEWVFVSRAKLGTAHTHTPKEADLPDGAIAMYRSVAGERGQKKCVVMKESDELERKKERRS